MQPRHCNPSTLVNRLAILAILAYFVPLVAGAEDKALTASFDGDIRVNLPSVVRVQNRGGRLIDDGVAGHAVRFRDGEYLMFDPASVLNNGRGGTISMWVRPHWNYYAAKDDNLVSHTFLSFRWSDGAYFVLSDGWWEPGGAYYTYFVLNNLQIAHVKAVIKYRENQWVHLAVTWEYGRPGKLKLYVDGELVAEAEVPINHRTLQGPVFLGSDQGTYLSHSRWADSDIDNLRISGYPIDAPSIRRMVKEDYPGPRSQTAGALKVNLQPSNSGEAKSPIGGLAETRAIFLEGPGDWISESKAQHLIARIKRAGFNVLVPCVWHGDGTRYPSDVAPTAPYKAPGDPLERLIRLAHEQGIEVHPWFTVVYRSRKFLPEFYDRGTPPDAFEIHRPEFREFIVRVILDVVRRYDVDGVNLDFIRSMGISQSEFASAVYRQRYGREIEKDVHLFDSRGRMEPHLQAFIDDAVEDVVRKVATGARALRPSIVVSVDGQPIPSMLPSSAQGRQEARWAKRGLVDAIFAMHYGLQPDVDGFDIATREIGPGASQLMLVSDFDDIGGLPVSRQPEILEQLVRLAQSKGNGVGIYAYSMLSDAQVDALATGPFRHAARATWVNKQGVR